MYDYYKAARDAAWQTLINCNIQSLPVDLTAIATHYDITVVRYSKSLLMRNFNPETISGDGFITKINNKKVIFLNDQIKTRGRRRFTLGHELGHGILNHPLHEIIPRNDEIDSETDPLEMQANVFSRDILMPACVLHALNIDAIEKIMSLCDISEQSAKIRLKRMLLLRKRNAFGRSPLERKVFKQFGGFIAAINNK